jgi:hypothetical protein
MRIIPNSSQYTTLQGGAVSLVVPKFTSTAGEV